jgi:hypothetical protein
MLHSSARLISAALACSALALGAGGCAVGVRGPVPLGSVVYVDRAPPAAYNEVITVSPGPGYVWIGGYHGWNGRDYVWNRGHWALPARGYSRWSPGYWHRDGRGHYWIAGRWQ